MNIGILVENPPGSSSGGAVSSVNGLTGGVVINPTNLGVGASQTLRSAGSITSALNPTSFSFVERGVYRPKTLIEPDFILGEMIWNADPNGFLSKVVRPSGDSWSVATGQLSLPAQSDSNLAFNAFEARTQLSAPYFAIEVPIIAFPADGSITVVTANLCTGISGSNPRGIQLKWDRHTGVLGVYTFDSAGVTTVLSEAAFTPPSTPFTLAMTYACRSITAQVRTTSGNYYTHVRAVMPADGLYDLRLPTNIAAFNIISIQSVQYQNTGALVLGNITWGYLAGINGLADKTMKYLDGTPIVKGNSHFLINSMQHIAASSPEGAPSATFTIQEVDPTRRYVKTRAMVFVVRTVGGFQHIEGENSGVCAYDPVADDFIYLIPNWGDYRSGGSFGPINTYMYRRKGFPSGVIVLTGGQVFSGLPTATSDYDPDLYDDGTLIHMTYTRTSTTTTWTNYATTHATTPRASFAPGCTWTLVANQSISGANCEGAKFFKCGGTRYIISTDNNATNQKVFDFNLNQLGTFSAPANTPTGIPHACMINFRDGPNDRIFWLYFDNAKYDGFTNTWGAIHFFENATQQVGHDFEHRVILDA